MDDLVAEQVQVDAFLQHVGADENVGMGRKLELEDGIAILQPSRAAEHGLHPVEGAIGAVVQLGPLGRTFTAQALVDDGIEAGDPAPEALAPVSGIAGQRRWTEVAVQEA